MGIRVIPPTDWRDDPGEWERLYPIEDKQEFQTILYDKEIQRTGYIQANIVACFDEWFRSFFPSNYFKFTRIRTQSTYTEFKSFMKLIYKKEKPFLVIDPASVEHVEDSLFGLNMINRYNLVDPMNDNFGAKLLYSIQLMKDENFEIVYRRDRFRFEFNILIMEQNMTRQANVYNMLLMNIRHNSKFLLHRTIPHLIPNRYIINIAHFRNMEWQSEEFLQYLNSVSQYPIIRRITPNGKYLFFFQQEMNIQVEVPGLPQKDSPETSNAIEWGARITDSFTMIADLPTEFLFMIPEEMKGKYDNHIDETDDMITYISPIYADLDWPTEYGDYKLTNRVDIMLQEGDDPHLDLKPVIANDIPQIHDTIMEFIQKDEELSDIVMVKVYPNGSYQEAAYEFNKNGILTLINPEFNKLYTMNIYIDLRTLNMIRECKNKKFIGDIEKY